MFSVFLAEWQRQRRCAAGSWRDAVHPGDQAVSDRKWRRSGQLWAGTRKKSFVCRQSPVFARVCQVEGHTSSGVYVLCIDSHARRELPSATQVFVVVFVLCLSSVCVLVLEVVFLFSLSAQICC